MAKRDVVRYRRWFGSFLLCSFVPLFLIGGFNYRVDRFGLFHFDKGLKISAMSLLDGKKVAGRLDRYEEREFQRLIIENYSQRRDVVLIGSSRNMLSRKSFLRDDVDFFNHSLTGPALEDHIAIIGFYQAKGNMPRTVILGIDPWMFNKNNGFPPWWKSFHRYYQAVVTEIYGREMKMSLFQPERYLQLINLEFTRENYKYLRKRRKSPKLTTTDTVDIDNFVREPDGSVYFPYPMRFKTDERPNYPADAKSLPLLNHFESLSGIELFEDFVGYLRNKRVEVVLMLLPFHPAIYKFFNEDPRYRIVITLEGRLRDFALRSRVKLIGSYDPGKYQLEGKDFIDDIHGHEIVAEKVFAEYSPNK